LTGQVVPIPLKNEIIIDQTLVEACLS